MASVHKRKGSRYWHLAYRLPNGRRKLVSSKTTDRYDAMRLALALEGYGRRERESTRARRLVDEIDSSRECGAPGETIGVLLRGWLNSRQGDAPATRRSRESAAKTMIARLGTIPLCDFFQSDLEAYRNHLVGAGRSPATVRWHIAMLRQALAPLRPGIWDIDLPKQGQPVRQALSLHQWEQLLQKTSGEWHDLILVAGLTGQRLGDCLALCGEDFRDGMIWFRRSKNKDVHPVPADARLRGLGARTGRLFPELGSPPLPSVSRAFRGQILPLIGVTQEYRSGGKGGRVVARLSFHSIRHMVATELNARGVSAETRHKILGHASPRVAQGYTHVDLQTASNALAMLTTGNK
jgi:integrase